MMNRKRRERILGKVLGLDRTLVTLTADQLKAGGPVFEEESTQVFSQEDALAELPLAAEVNPEPLRDISPRRKLLVGIGRNPSTGRLVLWQSAQGCADWIDGFACGPASRHPRHRAIVVVAMRTGFIGTDVNDAAGAKPGSLTRATLA